MRHKQQNLPCISIGCCLTLACLPVKERRRQSTHSTNFYPFSCPFLSQGYTLATIHFFAQAQNAHQLDFRIRTTTYDNKTHEIHSAKMFLLAFHCSTTHFDVTSSKHFLWQITIEFALNAYAWGCFLTCCTELDTAKSTEHGHFNCNLCVVC